MDRLTSMQVFAKVASIRSFSGAARELGISQATASKHIQTLEQWLGGRLLDRTTRRVDLTEFGEGFYAQCLRILEEVADARRSTQPSGPLHGLIRMTAPTALSSVRLGRTLANFVEQHTAVSLDLVATDRQVDVIEEGFDIALRLGASGESGLSARWVTSFPSVLCASPTYIKRYGAPAQPQELVNHVCAVDTTQPRQSWRLTGPDGEMTVTVGGRLRSNNALALRDAALAGSAMLLAPQFLVADALATGALLEVLPGYTAEAQALNAMFPQNRQVSPKVRALVTFLSEQLAGTD